MFLYDNLKKHKDMDETSVDELKQYDYEIFSVSYNGVEIVKHFLVPDYSSKTVLLLHSVSERFSNIIDKKIIARANRFLHWHEYKIYKKKDFLSYDFGGFALNSTDDELKGINEFKLSMGAKIKEVYAYMSYPAFFIKY